MAWAFYDASGRVLVLGVGGTGILHADLVDVTSGQHHAQAHSGTGADHTYSGLTTGHIFAATSSTTAGFTAPPTNISAMTLTLVIDGGGVVIVPGLKGSVRVPQACTVNSWEIVSVDNTSGSIVVDIWRDVYTNAPPLVGDVIMVGETPTLSSAVKATDVSLNGGAGYGLAAETWLSWSVASVTSLKVVAVALMLSRP